MTMYNAYMPTFENQKSVQIMLFKKKEEQS